jgi:toxin ParE1/3/4
MSAHRRELVLSSQAQDDLEEILLYTLTTWGEDQADRYRRILLQAADKLRDFPEMGKDSSSYWAGTRSIVVEQHVIFYRVDGANTVTIVTIVHSRQFPRGFQSR